VGLPSRPPLPQLPGAGDQERVRASVVEVLEISQAEQDHGRAVPEAR
jgi:hypothetical protein